tara:strand:- start:167 stop:895 length:729 start_codon:yes stop_codon:yes gene_type:complete
MFSSEISREIKYYVYLLSDPITDEIFYVGKGKGNRIFQHLKDRNQNDKTKKILDLKSQGLKPKMEILVHGIEDELTVKKIEAAIIDLIGKKSLTNKVSGYESSVFGRMTVDQIKAKYSSKKAVIKEKVILIKLSKTFRYNMDPVELYDNTRGIWHIAEHRRQSASYAFAIYDGIIQETYKILEWFEGGSTANFGRIDIERWKKYQRWEFVGNISDQMRKKYLYKSVDDYYPKNARNPIRYTY